MPHIQIRNVPPELHRKLKARAVQAGMSLSDYLLAEVRKSAEMPTMEEFVARVRSRSLVSPKESSADIIRRLRDERS
jgi:plasmid stability protein